MRFLYVKLTGYIGIYNGLGLSEIEIDFSNTRNKICIISGPNGVGKSTLNNALNILPDGNDNFVPSMNAGKYIRLTDGENIYDINISHPIDKNNNRAVSKASIKKNGLELNSNGNISSYKEIIFAEFNLDSNYMVLSKISGDDRGLADKRPAERKKIMAAHISSLEVYNNIFKNLNKKANIFKSYINNLSTKIQNVGNENNLRTTLLSIDSKLSKLQEIIEKSKEEIIKSKTIISMNDPNGEAQLRYKNLSASITEINIEKKSIYSKLCKAQELLDVNKEKVLNQEYIFELINNTSKRIEELKQEKLSNEMEAKNILSSISDINSRLDNIKISIDNISSEIDEKIGDNIRSFKFKLNNIVSEFSSVGISDIDDISKSEIEYIISFLTKFISDIDSLYEFMNVDSFQKLYDIKINNINIESKKESIIKGIEFDKTNKSIVLEDLQTVDNDILICSDLSKRPDNCKDDLCPFVNTALNIVSKYGTIEDMNNKKKSLLILLKECEKNILEKENLLIETDFMINICMKFDTITEYIRSNYQILKKFSITVDIIDYDIFLELIRTENRFNSLRDLNKFYNVSNLIIEYRSIKEVLTNLEKEEAVQQNKAKTKILYESEFNSLNHDLHNLKEKYNLINTQINFTSNLLSNTNNKLNNLTHYIDLLIEWYNSCDKYKCASLELDEVKKKLDSSLEIITKINDLELLVFDNTEQIKPLIEQKRNIESQITMLESFQIEYEMYKEKYIIIDKLKKYSSPTQGSIQSLFMSIYMDKTLSMVNELLGMIFNGQYKILDYVINENEFRIPFVGNGMPVDDISSGSTSQICIMGTIINLVLYNIGSSNFGIASLDEVDGGLDQANRYLFVDVIQKICDILNIDQLFTISHSIESALSSVDVILLSNSDEYREQFSNANIIYQFGK